MEGDKECIEILKNYRELRERRTILRGAGKEEERAQVDRLVRSYDRALHMLTPNQRLVVKRLFIDREAPERSGPGTEIDRLCEELALERSAVYRLRRQALDRIRVATAGAYRLSDFL